MLNADSQEVCDIMLSSSEESALHGNDLGEAHEIYGGVGDDHDFFGTHRGAMADSNVGGPSLKRAHTANLEPLLMRNETRNLHDVFFQDGPPQHQQHQQSMEICSSDDDSVINENFDLLKQ